MLKVFFLAHIR